MPTGRTKNCNFSVDSFNTYNASIGLLIIFVTYQKFKENNSSTGVIMDVFVWLYDMKICKNTRERVSGRILSL